MKAGAIGRVVQTVGLGPHRMNPSSVPRGSSTDRGTAASFAISLHIRPINSYSSPVRARADVAAAQVGNVHHRQYPLFEDFGDPVLCGDGGTG